MATIARFTHPDERRFQSLMEQSYRKVYNMAYRLSGNRADAEDLTQEAFFRAYRSFNDFEGDKPFENWIFRILNRLFLDLLRSRRRRIQAMSYDTPVLRDVSEDHLHFDMPDRHANAEETLLRATLNEDLQATLDALSPEQRWLIQKADIEQVPYKEIAKMLGKPIGTVRSRLHRAHKLMRDRLAKLKMAAEPVKSRWIAA